MRISVTIPTYNERENLQQLIPAVRSVCPQADVIIVDDNSSDGTAELMRDFQQRDPQVHFVLRPGKLGYASAIQAGHRYALNHGAEILCQMDADFSHNPQVLPVLIDKLERYDVSVGSRYVEGGGTKNWGLVRRWLSRSGNTFARKLLQLKPKDCTGGFRGFRRHAFERGGLLEITAEGYCFQIISIYHCQRAGLSICEVPILFEDRRVGKSKLSKRIICEAFFAVVKLWLQGR